MNVLYCCREVDDNARWTAAQVQWITTLASLPEIEHVHVLTTKLGKATLPPNVTIRQIWRGSWSRFVVSLWWEVLRAGPLRQDFFFVVQGGPFPVLLLPFKLLTRRPIYHWKAQPHVSRNMRFYARYCDDLVFTATEQSLRIDLPGKRVVGHGIDTDLFRPQAVEQDRDFITVGRLSPGKRIDVMIKAIAECKQAFGVAPRLDIVGRADGSSQAYADRLRDLVDELDLVDQVRFLGHVPYRDLPTLLPRYRASLNFSATAFDKAVGESMACGVPVVTSNSCVIETLPPDLLQHLAIDAPHIAEHAAALYRAHRWDRPTREWLQQRCRDYVLEQHSLRSFFTTILNEIIAHRGGAQPGSAHETPAPADPNHTNPAFLRRA